MAEIRHVDPTKQGKTLSFWTTQLHGDVFRVYMNWLIEKSSLKQNFFFFVAVLLGRDWLVDHLLGTVFINYGIVWTELDLYHHSAVFHINRIITIPKKNNMRSKTLVLGYLLNFYVSILGLVQFLKLSIPRRCLGFEVHHFAY